MACRKKCDQYKFKKKKTRTSDIYTNGGRWCSICEKFLSISGLFCPCCGQQVRKKPRNKHGIAIQTIIDSKRIK